MADALRAGNKEQLEVRQAEWASKKWTWLIDKKDGAVAASVIKEDGDKLVVATADGKVRAICCSRSYTPDGDLTCASCRS